MLSWPWCLIAGEPSMNEFMLELVKNGHIVPLGVVSLGILIGVVAIVATFWHKTRMAEMEASLKHKMLDQGMSAADIQMVLQAKGDESNQESKKSLKS
jgi:hypothetical protein